MTLDAMHGEATAQQHESQPEDRRVLKCDAATTHGTAVLMPLLPAISRTLSLSSQSSFHLSLMVLLRYRSLASVWLWMGITTRFVLQSRATRLNKDASDGDDRRTVDGVVTLYDPLSQQRVVSDTSPKTLL